MALAPVVAAAMPRNRVVNFMVSVWSVFYGNGLVRRGESEERERAGGRCGGGRFGKISSWLFGVGDEMEELVCRVDPRLQASSYNASAKMTGFSFSIFTRASITTITKSQ